MNCTLHYEISLRRRIVEGVKLPCINHERLTYVRTPEYHGEPHFPEHEQKYTDNYCDPIRRQMRQKEVLEVVFISATSQTGPLPGL